MTRRAVLATAGRLRPAAKRRTAAPIMWRPGAEAP